MFQATKIHALHMNLAATAGKKRKSPSERPPIIMALPEGPDGQLLSCPRPLRSPVVASLAAQRGSSSSSASCFSAVAGGGVAAAVTTTTTESLFAAGIAAAVSAATAAAIQATSTQHQQQSSTGATLMNSTASEGAILRTNLSPQQHAKHYSQPQRHQIVTNNRPRRGDASDNCFFFLVSLFIL